jgi:hypothetical protein
VTALLRGTDERDPSTATAFRLRAAGTDFPKEILDRYAAEPADGIIGPNADALLDAILDITGPDPNEYDLAKTIERYLQDPTNFEYQADVTAAGVNCGDLSRVECFATYRVGFCRWYAATMAALMRDEGWPVRIAEGFRRGSRLPDSPLGTYVVRNSDAHAWVEVYFPAYGWVDFDPTGGGLSQLPAIPVGRPEGSGAPKPSATVGQIPIPSGDLGDSREPPFRGGGPIDSAPIGTFLAITLVLAVLVGGLAFAAWARGPRGPATPERAYRSVTRLASRFGFGPRPNQTVYEYAGALAEVVPIARSELELVALAKVETTYGGRTLTQDRLAALKDAERRLRVRLLRLVFRRDRRRRR